MYVILYIYIHVCNVIYIEADRNWAETQISVTSVTVTRPKLVFENMIRLRLERNK